MGHIKASALDGLTYLFILPWKLNDFGGVNMVVGNLYREFLNRNMFRPMVLVNSWEHPTETCITESGRETLYLRMRSFPSRDESSLKEVMAFLINWPTTLWKILIMLRRNRIGIVNPHYPGLYLIHFAILKILFPATFKLVVSFHGRDVAEMENSSYYTYVMKWILKRANAITVPSYALATRLGKVCPDIGPRIKVIYNGVDRDIFMNAGSHSPLLPQHLQGKQIILQVGLDSVKGPDILLESFRRLYTRHQEAYLVLVGHSRSAFLEEIRDSIKNLGLTDRVHILTDVGHDDIPSLMKNAAVIVHPSRSEGGIPLVLLEAGMTNRAVVASRIGGIPELIVDGQNGLLVQPEDHVQLATAISKLLDDNALNKRLADSLFVRISEAFFWEQTACEYANLFKTKKQ